MKLLLTNVVWDNTYRETRYFENVSVRNEWFGLPDSLVDRPNVNFNVGGDLVASCVINNDVTSNLTRMNYNYIVVHDEVNDEYLFYFINSCRYINARQIQYNLELDVLTTYLPTISALPSHMYSAHIDRFKKSNDQVIYFDTGYQSKIWLEDIPNLAKRLRYKVPIKWKYTNNDLVDNWLNENILCWLYVFISLKEYNMGTFNLSGVVTDIKYNVTGVYYPKETYSAFNYIQGQYGVLCFPIYKTDKRIQAYHLENSTTPKTYPFTNQAFEFFKLQNNDDSNTFSYVISNIPPISSFVSLQYDSWYLDDNGNLTVDDDVENGTDNPNSYQVVNNDTTTTSIEDAKFCPFFTPRFLRLEPIKSYPIYLSQIGYITSFDRDLTKGYNYDDFLPEPKLSKMGVKEMQITSSFGNNFTFDGLKISNDKQFIEFSLYSPITPGSNASLVRPIFDDEDDGVYQVPYNNEIIGLLTNYDSTLPFAVNQLDAYLSSNKNFFTQRALGVGVSVGSGIINIATKDYVNAIRNFGEAIIKPIEDTLTLDNMRNAPETYKDSASNILLDLSILTDFGYYVEVWDALDIDKKIYLDNINHFGYVLNIEDDMTKYFHTRKYFNYVRGDIHSISNNLSNAVKNKIKSIFNNGVRLFHRDNFEDPVTQNYELSLED